MFLTLNPQFGLNNFIFVVNFIQIIMLQRIQSIYLLLAGLVDYLTEGTLVREQPHANHGYTQVARGLELITSYVTEPTRVNWQRLAQHVLHAEIRDTTQRRLRISLLEPPRRPSCSAPGKHQIVNSLPKKRLSQVILELLP